MNREPLFRRRDAARHLIHPHQFRESLSFRPQASFRNSTLAGLQAALTVLIALPIVYYSPWPHLVGFASLGALVAVFGRFELRGRRKLRLLECALIQVGSVLIISAAAWLGASLFQQLALLAVVCGVVYFLCMAGRFGPPGPLIFVFAASASISAQGLSFQHLIERISAVAVVAALALVLCVVTDYLRHEPNEQRAFPIEPRLPLRPLLVRALRCTVAAGLAMAIGAALGGEHPAWAALGAMAVLQGPRLNVMMNRALQRMLGSVFGALLAWILLSMAPEVFVVILVLAALQAATEMVIGYNYALGQIFVTPMALLMTWLGASQLVGSEIASERVIETCIGAVVGVLLALIFSSADDRQHLAHKRLGRYKSI